MKEENPEDRYKKEIEDDPTKIDLQPEDLKKVPKSIWTFLKSTLSIKDDVDVDATIMEINDEIEFRGHNVWVLVFSILVASIGLDADSVAVVIGAMLISPLMGPIKGVGLAVGTNNFKLLIKSLKNFGIMVGISIIVSYIYFRISPFKDPSEQILARTQPDFRDALIAFFGGFAGIIASTQKGKSITVISGVAIATALMPPLCSAGFMLANADFPKLFNAFYLFLINSLLICMAALIVIRYLKFPLVQFVNPKTERKVKVYITVFMLLILVPSIYKFYYVMIESSFQRSVNAFITNEIESYPGAKLKNWDLEYTYGDTSVIHIEFREDGFVSEELITSWAAKLDKYDLNKVKLDIDDSNLKREVATFTYEDLLKREDEWRADRKEMDREMDMLRKRIGLYRKQLNSFSDLNRNRALKLHEEAKINFPDIEKISFSIGLEAHGSKTDTITTVMVHWRPNMSDSIRNKETIRLSRWLKADLENDNLRIIPFTHGQE